MCKFKGIKKSHPVGSIWYWGKMTTRIVIVDGYGHLSWYANENILNIFNVRVATPSGQRLGNTKVFSDLLTVRAKGYIHVFQE